MSDKTFEPSAYQSAIFQWIKTGTGNAVVQAVAGSGKTTTMIEALGLVRAQYRRVAFFAFNTHIKDEISQKLITRGLPGITVATLHSHGFSAVKKFLGTNRIAPDGRKLSQIVRALVDDDSSETLVLRRGVERLADLCRMTLTDPSDQDALTGLAEKHDIDLNGDLDNAVLLVPKVLDLDRRTGLSGTSIDFGDMIYLPNVVKAPVTQFDFIMADESQDFNAAQRALLLKSIAPGGRILAVGDRFQSIYGFAGADTESIPNLIRECSAVTLPLSICYRCPSSHVALAKEIVPQIEARENAPKGKVESLSYDEGVMEMREGDLVISRVNAPLAKVAMGLIRRGQKAIIRGRDISSSLITLIEKHGGRGVGIEDSIRLLASYKEREVAKLQKAEKHAQAVALEDRVETIVALSDGVKSVAELKRRIESIFSDDSKVGVVCSSVHRAKGLEADRVFLYRQELLPHPKATQEWELAQEMNLRYVALTRAKKELYFVSKEKD